MGLINHIMHLKRFCCGMLMALTALVLFSAPACFAQEQDKITVTPVFGRVDSNVRKKAYLYPQFTDGKAISINGITTLSKFNYNLLTGEVEFIDANKDTLAIADMKMIKTIAIGDDLYFYNNQGEFLLKMVETYNTTSLLKEQKYQLTNMKTKGAMGTQSNSQAPSNAPNLYNDGVLQPLTSDGTMEFSVKTYYYFVGKDNRFFLVNKSNLMKMYADSKGELSKYLKENKINFKNEESVKKVLSFSDQLSKK